MTKRAVRWISVALALALAVALCAAGALAESIEVKLNASTKVYQSASTSSRSTKISKGLKVTLTAYGDGWGKISYKGNTGYVKLKYLDRVHPVKVYVTGSATFYKKAGSGKQGTLSRGDVMYLLGVDGRYARVQNESGSKKGYVKSSLLSTSKVSASSSSSASDSIPSSLRSKTTSASESRIEYAIYVAQNQMDKPYSSHSDPPESFDCATFTHYCYGKAKSGSVRGSTKSQGYDDRYDKISYSNLKRGDLVFFDTVTDSDLCDHVGIYLGQGYFIHASSAAKKVILSSLKSGYYKRTFSWGRRVFSK